MKFEFKKCPVCGDEGPTVGQQMFEGFEMGGRPPGLQWMVLAKKDVRLAIATVPTITAVFDVCAKCGTYRCILAEDKDAPIVTQMKPVNRRQ